jgi:hypothetical protein
MKHDDVRWDVYTNGDVAPEGELDVRLPDSEDGAEGKELLERRCGDVTRMERRGVHDRHGDDMPVGILDRAKVSHARFLTHKVMPAPRLELVITRQTRASPEYNEWMSSRDDEVRMYSPSLRLGQNMSAKTTGVRSSIALVER